MARRATEAASSTGAPWTATTSTTSGCAPRRRRAAQRPSRELRLLRDSPRPWSAPARGARTSSSPPRPRFRLVAWAPRWPSGTASPGCSTSAICGRTPRSRWARWSRRPALPDWRARLERRLYRSAAAITATTEDFVRAIEGRGGAGKRSCWSQRHAAARYLEAGGAAATPRRSGTRDGRFTWTYAGNLGLAQGLEAAIEAASMLGERLPAHPDRGGPAAGGSCPSWPRAARPAPSRSVIRFRPRRPRACCGHRTRCWSRLRRVSMGSSLRSCSTAARWRGRSSWPSAARPRSLPGDLTRRSASRLAIRPLSPNAVRALAEDAGPRERPRHRGRDFAERNSRERGSRAARVDPRGSRGTRAFGSGAKRLSTIAAMSFQAGRRGPMTALLTGVAGFIGSHLAEQLLDDGVDVRGVDRFSDYYDPAVKRGNLASLDGHDGFELVDGDLNSAQPGRAARRGRGHLPPRWTAGRPGQLGQRVRDLHARQRAQHSASPGGLPGAADRAGSSWPPRPRSTETRRAFPPGRTRGPRRCRRTG